MFNTLNITQIVMTACIAVLGLAAHAASSGYKGYDMPNYTVEHVTDEIEIRRYDPHVVAEVQVAGDRGAAINRGFRMLAGYIFGGNETDTKIAMTVPVSQLPLDGGWTVRFMMPEGYAASSLPKPDNPAIRFVETRPERHLVVQFSGGPGDASLAEKSRMLTEYADAAGLIATDAPRFHFYDSPVTLPWKRRNEVSLPIE